ncbi:hypothetical protein, partial [Klebsiella pneumoniae]|uniref:hypothetical protein n=1 Tax=Klebsiella pneumoniae TaxID=573 RepID=UPI0039DF7E62
HYNYWFFNQPVFFPFAGICPTQERLRLADCYHRLIYYDRSNGSLNVDSLPPRWRAVPAQ